jgi:hypothetical protein
MGQPIDGFAEFRIAAAKSAAKSKYQQVAMRRTTPLVSKIKRPRRRSTRIGISRNMENLVASVLNVPT